MASARWCCHTPLGPPRPWPERWPDARDHADGAPQRDPCRLGSLREVTGTSIISLLSRGGVWRDLAPTLIVHGTARRCATAAASTSADRRAAEAHTILRQPQLRQDQLAEEAMRVQTLRLLVVWPVPVGQRGRMNFVCWHAVSRRLHASAILHNVEQRVTEVVVDLHVEGIPDETIAPRRTLIAWLPDQPEHLFEKVLQAFDMGTSPNSPPVQTDDDVDFSVEVPYDHVTGGPTIAQVVVFTVTAMTTGVIGNATYDRLKRCARSIIGNTPRETKPLTDAEATIWGFAMIARRYKLDADDLHLLSVALKAPNATIRASGQDGTIYTAEIEIIDGLAVLGDSSRELPRAN